jgi:hypothetical protein
VAHGVGDRLRFVASDLLTARRPFVVVRRRAGEPPVRPDWGVGRNRLEKPSVPRSSRG